MRTGHCFVILVSNLVAGVSDVGVDLDLLEIAAVLGRVIQHLDPGKVITTRMLQVASALNQKGECAVHGRTDTYTGVEDEIFDAIAIEIAAIHDVTRINRELFPIGARKYVFETFAAIRPL